MKKVKVSILALSVLVGGAVFASAANNGLTLASTDDIVLTNAVPMIWSSVNEVPTSLFLVSSNTFFSAGIVDTDSGGKITGVGNLIRLYWSGTNVIGASSFYVTIKGKISASQMGVPSVQMTINGNGYTVPSVSNTVAIAGVDHKDAWPGSVNLNFTAKNTAAVSNNFAYHILGNLKGTFKPGLAAVASKTVKIDEAADLVVNRQTLSELDLRVILFGKKFAAILTNPNMENPSGTGNLNTKNGQYSVNLKPIGGGSSSLQLKGGITTLVDPSNTNRVITTINTADAKGKIQGQAVQSTGYKVRTF